MNPLVKLKRSFLLKKARKSPHFGEFFRETDLSKKVEEATFVVFDCEATDLNPKKAELLSIGALRVRSFGLNLGERFEAYIRAEKLKASEIHGITREDLERFGRPPKAVIKEFLKYIRGSILVGFYVRFDASLVEKYSLRYFSYPLLNYKLDLFSLYKSTYGKAGSLDEILSELGIEIKGRHTALNDAYATALAFIKLLKGYEGKKLGTLPLFV
ncbi:3'-5' exonuclease [Aquifex sp.]